ncbi:tetratricopeptide repeat protein [candidate division KSB1 bacterium]|nr:tetratricopeptide repeat protein [candidate division KSB1 bacterium]
MRCLFWPTKKFSRCKNNSKFLFCKQHRLQPIIVFLAFFGFLADYTELWQSMFKTMFSRTESPRLDYSITADRMDYAPGLLVDDVIWEQDFASYLVELENSSSSAEIFDLRVDLLLHGGVVNYKIMAQQGCEDITFFQYDAVGGIKSGSYVRTTGAYYVNNLSINVVRLFPQARFTVQIILKFAAVNEDGLFRIQYRFKKKLDGSTQVVESKHPIVLVDKENKLINIDKKKPPSDKLFLQIIPKKTMTFKEDGSILYGTEGQADEAIKQYNLAISRDPGSAPSYFNLGQIYARRNQIDQAIENYKLAIKYKPDHTEAHLELGYAYAQKGIFDEAIKELEIALRYRPNSATAYNYLGITYNNKGQIDSSIKNYKLAIQEQNDYPEAHYNLAMAFFKKGLIDEAVSHLELVKEYRPDVADTYLHLGLAYNKKGQKENARESFKAFLKYARNDKNRAKQIQQVERILRNIESQK